MAAFLYIGITVFVLSLLVFLHWFFPTSTQDKSVERHPKPIVTGDNLLELLETRNLFDLEQDQDLVTMLKSAIGSTLEEQRPDQSPHDKRKPSFDIRKKPKTRQKVNNSYLTPTFAHSVELGRKPKRNSTPVKTTYSSRAPNNFARFKNLFSNARQNHSPHSKSDSTTSNLVLQDLLQNELPQNEAHSPDNTTQPNQSISEPSCCLAENQKTEPIKPNEIELQEIKQLPNGNSPLKRPHSENALIHLETDLKSPEDSNLSSLCISPSFDLPSTSDSNPVLMQGSTNLQDAETEESYSLTDEDYYSADE